MLKMQDSPGRLPVATMRTYFEGAINHTPALLDRVPLGVVNSNAKFSHYAQPETDTLWVGFALGLRYAERLQAAATSQDYSPRLRLVGAPGGDPIELG